MAFLGVTVARAVAAPHNPNYTKVSRLDLKLINVQKTCAIHSEIQYSLSHNTNQQYLPVRCKTFMKMHVFKGLTSVLAEV